MNFIKNKCGRSGLFYRHIDFWVMIFLTLNTNMAHAQNEQGINNVSNSRNDDAHANKELPRLGKYNNSLNEEGLVELIEYINKSNP